MMEAFLRGQAADPKQAAAGEHGPGRKRADRDAEIDRVGDGRRKPGGKGLLTPPFAGKNGAADLSGGGSAKVERVKGGTAEQTPQMRAKLFGEGEQGENGHMGMTMECERHNSGDVDIGADQNDIVAVRLDQLLFGPAQILRHALTNGSGPKERGKGTAESGRQGVAGAKKPAGALESSDGPGRGDDGGGGGRKDRSVHLPAKAAEFRRKVS